MTRTTTLLKTLTLPALIAHELTHGIASLPYSESISLVVRPREVFATVRVSWRREPPRAGLVLAGLAPTIAGLIAGVVALAFWISNGAQMPSTGMGLLRIATLAGYWAVYVMPSPDDIATATNGGIDDE